MHHIRNMGENEMDKDEATTQHKTLKQNSCSAKPFILPYLRESQYLTILFSEGQHSVPISISKVIGSLSCRNIIQNCVLFWGL